MRQGDEVIDPVGHNKRYVELCDRGTRSLTPLAEVFDPVGLFMSELGEGAV